MVLEFIVTCQGDDLELNVTMLLVLDLSTDLHWHRVTQGEEHLAWVAEHGA